MADLVNLRLARKRRDRAAREEQAAQNRLIHGRSGAQKAADRAETDKVSRLLDGHRLSARTRDDDA